MSQAFLTCKQDMDAKAAQLHEGLHIREQNLKKNINTNHTPKIYFLESRDIF